MARKANVIVYTCTFCKVSTGEDVAASMMTVFDLGVEEDDLTNFDITVRTYQVVDFKADPKDKSVFGSCPSHSEKVLTGQIAAFAAGMQAIQGAIEEEEKADLPVQDEPEGWEEEEEEGEEEEEEEGGKKALIDNMITGEGKKVVPTPPEVARVINKTARPKVSNPPTEVEEMEEWQQYFADGYVPDSTPPKGEEREECLTWFNRLPRHQKDTYTNGKGFPEPGKRGRWPGNLATEWRKSREYAVYAGHINA